MDKNSSEEKTEAAPERTRLGLVLVRQSVAGKVNDVAGWSSSENIWMNC